MLGVDGTSAGASASPCRALLDVVVSLYAPAMLLRCEPRRVDECVQGVESGGSYGRLGAWFYEAVPVPAPCPPRLDTRCAGSRGATPRPPRPERAQAVPRTRPVLELRITCAASGASTAAAGGGRGGPVLSALPSLPVRPTPRCRAAYNESDLGLREPNRVLLAGGESLWHRAQGTGDVDTGEVFAELVVDEDPAAAGPSQQRAGARTIE